MQDIRHISEQCINNLQLKVDKSMPFNTRLKSSWLEKEFYLIKNTAQKILDGKIKMTIKQGNTVRCPPAELNIKYQRNLAKYKTFMPELTRALNTIQK